MKTSVIVLSDEKVLGLAADTVRIETFSATSGVVLSSSSEIDVGFALSDRTGWSPLSVMLTSWSEQGCTQVVPSGYANRTRSSGVRLVNLWIWRFSSSGEPS